MIYFVYMVARFSYLSHLQCSVCSREYEADQLHTISPCCSRPLLARYDLMAMVRDVTREEIAQREATIAAYHILLARHFLEPGDETVLFLTGSGLTDIGK
ncbi:MAG: hypothetical protein NVSMB27_22790 [Ktedonobacteraceae bacterium]